MESQTSCYYRQREFHNKCYTFYEKLHRQVDFA